MSTFSCRHEYRLAALKEAGGLSTLNAIDYVEVRDTDEPITVLRQRTLYLRTIRPVPIGGVGAITPAHIRIIGGDRIRQVDVSWVARADATGSDVPPGAATGWPALVADVDEPDHVLVIRTAERGDFSIYTLELVVPGTEAPAVGFDEQLSSVILMFKVECPSDYDCAPLARCTDEPDRTGPRIDYLAKDWTGFRRILLERVSQLSQSWSERNPADVGVAVVEMLAYAADELSWRQDAIATEAYLGTARSRVSLRRHARLVDYRVHEGCNARAFVRVRTTAVSTALPAHTMMFTRVPDTAPAVTAASDALRRALQHEPEVFETCTDAVLNADCDVLPLYGWGDPSACLPQGAIGATLSGHHPGLEPGDVLVLGQTAGALSGLAVDADPTLRFAVRLTSVTLDDDPAGGLFNVPATSGGVDVTRLTWHRSDALPEALPLVQPGTATAVAMAWGNIVLVDHGRTVDVGNLTTPALQLRPLTFAAPLPGPDTPARDILTGSNPRFALPAVALTGTRLTAVDQWAPRHDLLASSRIDRHYVVEIDTDGTARLRFGDGVLGRAPDPGTVFSAVHRVGNGSAGNLGPQAIAHVVTANTTVIGVENPLPAVGGQDAESVEQIRRDAPQAFFIQQRAVTPADYAEVSQRSGAVQRAAATFRWTGSWRTVFVTADRPGAAAVDAAFEDDLRAWLERFRMAGYDLEVDAPVFVPLDLEVTVCAGPHHLRSDISREARSALHALFDADRLTFGEPVRVSDVYAALHAIEGVQSVQVERFERLGEPLTSGLDEGILPMQRLEIARLDDDPNFPERGRLRLTVGGGR